jgi:hypothetical protein
VAGARALDDRAHPLCAIAVADVGAATGLPEFGARVAEFLEARPEHRAAVQLTGDDADTAMLALVGEDRLPRILARLADEAEFLSPYGIRSLSAAYRGRPFEFSVAGQPVSSVDYEPAESTTALFGGNSNWRGPIWFPVNFLVVTALERFARRLGDGLRVEFPLGSGRELTLHEVVAELSRRLVATFLPGPDGARPVFGGREIFRADPAWRDALLFHEYFHGDDGTGLGASHQTGWTGLVADMVIRLSDGRIER